MERDAERGVDWVHLCLLRGNETGPSGSGRAKQRQHAADGNAGMHLWDPCVICLGCSHCADESR